MKAILWVVALVAIVGSSWWIYNRQSAGKGFGDSGKSAAAAPKKSSDKKKD